MKSHFPRVLMLSGLGLYLCLNVLADSAPYAITDLGTLGGSTSQALGINSRGDITGTAQTTVSAPTIKHAFLYKAGSMYDLGTIAGSLSWGMAINDSDMVAGYSSTTASSGNLHAILATTNGMKDLGTLGGNTSKAYGINNLGEVVGTASDAFNNSHPFLYNGATMDALLGAATGTATVINDSHQIGGWVTTNCSCAQSSHAFKYFNGVFTDLAQLPGLDQGFVASFVNGINQKGLMTGAADDTNQLYERPFDFGGAISNLTFAPGGPLTNATTSSINDFGQIVGKNLSTTRAILFTGGRVVDLNSTIPADSHWTLVFATGINNNGQICGYGANPAGDQHAFLLTPRPILYPPDLVGGAMQFQMQCMTGATYRVEYSTEPGLGIWNTLTNVTPTTTPCLIIDSSQASSRLYRAVLAP